MQYSFSGTGNSFHWKSKVEVTFMGVTDADTAHRRDTDTDTAGAGMGEKVQELLVAEEMNVPNQPWL